MRKVLVGLAVVVAVAFAFSAMAADTQVVKEKEKITTKGDEVKTVEKIKTSEGKEKITTTENVKTGEVAATDVTKVKEGKVWKDTVKFHKYEANGDWIYVMKDDKVIRLKHTLSDSDKKMMLQKKQGETVTITSTYPLSDNIAVITRLQ